jgi:hypothetical protein
MRGILVNFTGNDVYVPFFFVWKSGEYYITGELNRGKYELPTRTFVSVGPECLVKW